MLDDLFSYSVIHENFKPIVNDDLKILVVGKLSSLCFFVDHGCIRSVDQVFNVTVAPTNKLAFPIKQKGLFFLV
jgi:hypothetical protein